MFIVFLIRSVQRQGKYSKLYGLAANDLVSATLAFVGIQLLASEGNVSVSAALVLCAVLASIISILTVKKKLLAAENLAKDIITEQLSEAPHETPAENNPVTVQEQKEDSDRDRHNLPTPIFMVVCVFIKMKLSADFFRPPTMSEIKSQYKKQQKSVPVTDPKGKKKIIAEEDTAADKSGVKKRSSLGARLLDFSKKNRFKTSKSKQTESPITKMKLPQLHHSNMSQSKETLRQKEIEDRVEDTENRGLRSEQSETRPCDPEEKREEPDCVICFANKADVICMPCGHGGVCRECMLRICLKEAVCFSCKKKVYNLLRIDPARQVGEMVIVLSSIPVGELSHL